MAGVMPCDGPDKQPSVFLVQNIAEAEVMTFCLSCMLDFSQALLMQFAPDRLAPPPKPATRKRRATPAAAQSDDSEGGGANAGSNGEKAGQATG